MSEPGWFINNGEWTEHEITTEGDVSRVVDSVHGEFSIRTVEFPSNTIEYIARRR